MRNPTESFKGKVALFSGRFDFIHLFHWITVLRLLKEYGFDKVVIVVLDYPERKFAVGVVMQLWKELIRNSGLDDTVGVMTNTTHFREVTDRELQKIMGDDFARMVYISGNWETYRHLYNLGIECLFVEASYGIHASDYELKVE